MLLRIPSAIIRLICFAIELYTIVTPKRWEKIQLYVKERIQSEPSIERTPICEIGTGRQIQDFNVDLITNLKHVINHIPNTRLYTDLLPQDILLLPEKESCCGKALKFHQDRWSDVSLYLRDGVVKAKAYHLTCSKCSTQYWHSYYDQTLGSSDNVRSFYFADPLPKYTLLSRATAFETKYLREVAVDIELGRSFEDVTERYNRLYGTQSPRGGLNERRLEDGFFVMKLLQFYQEDIKLNVNNVSNRINVDTLCDNAVTQIFTSDNEWKDHKCSIKGCLEGFVMCDGNEKLGRRICAAPRDNLRLGKGMPSIVSKCGNSPVFGGQSQKASKFCREHADLDSKEPAKKKILLTINIPDQLVSTRIIDISATLPSNDDTSVHIACKKAANVKHFHERTAGIMAIIRPCGIIMDWREMYTCESSSQLFVQLLKLVDEPDINIEYIGYDRVCEFVPFLRNLKAKGNVGAEKLLEKLYLVDKFHIAGHKTAPCDIDNPLCEYHPKLPRFNAIANANTEIAEQTFSWIKRFKHIVKYMTAHRFRFFMHVVITAHNKVIEKRC